MTKRRRPGAKKLVEARFWGRPDHVFGAGVGDAVSGPSGSDGNSEPSNGREPAHDNGNGQVAGPRGWRPPGIRPTPDPGALVRSLGPPPLAVDPAVAERHLTAVYEEAVRAATALAAANGLLATDDPDDQAS